MTAMQVNDLAFKYAEELASQVSIDAGATYYYLAAAWFKEHGGTKEDYSVFIDLVHMWTRNHNELLLSDAYCNAPEWKDAGQSGKSRKHGGR